MGVHKKQQTMQFHCLMLPLCNCIAGIAKELKQGTTFENQMLRLGGDQQFDFSVMEKKRDKRCPPKVGDGEVGVKRNNVPYTYNFFSLQ